ncbi:MAG: hypothetical protein ACRDND_30035, partial [Streptosporangiaceae bacterium]
MIDRMIVNRLMCAERRLGAQGPQDASVTHGTHISQSGASAAPLEGDGLLDTSATLPGVTCGPGRGGLCRLT